MNLTAAPCPLPEIVVRPHPRPDAERDFYEGYAWCLNPFLTIREATDRLAEEIARLRQPLEDWQIGEAATNVFLLSGALLHGVEEYLRGKALRLPGSLAAHPAVRGVRWAAEKLGGVWCFRRRAHARQWREAWLTGLDVFLPLLGAEPARRTALAEAGAGLAALLRTPLPADLLGELTYFPSAFRRLDLSHLDVLTLARRLTDRFPDRRRPILALGLRTAGSYFAPLLRAFLRAEGYATADCVTVHPDKDPGAWEWAQLRRCAGAGHVAAILDDPPYTGDTFVRAVDMARKAGFAAESVAVLVPSHPAARDWTASLARSGTVVVSLAPGEWHKQRLLDAKQVEIRLGEYYQERRGSGVRVVADGPPEAFGGLQRGCPQDPRSARLKRVYEVRLSTAEGGEETRYFLAKSVGWGWLGYHAFLAGRRLAAFVPPVLGLRDGILYSEWLPQAQRSKAASGSAADSLEALTECGGEFPTCPSDPATWKLAATKRYSLLSGDREHWIETTASYVAARVRLLGLGNNPQPGLGLHRHHDGFRLLEKRLSKAYGRLVTAQLMRSRIRQRLAEQPCPQPTLIDGRMDSSEWVAGPEGLLKTDYEHHGLGKNELNAIDPAYDLAEAILHLMLSPEEESRLVRRYIEETGDAGVQDRLFLNKVLAGSWSMAAATKSLFGRPNSAADRQELNRRYIDALHFLTVHAARFCGGFCQPPKTARWRAPLVVLDVDGVVDRRLIGFPCTTAAGIEALSLLHSHDLAVALNTARSVAEVQEYCRAYGLAGGAAEYGSYVWDAVNRRGRSLATSESLRQLEKARKALQQLPGVFLDDRYGFSIRACTYEDEAATLRRLPIPGALRALLASPADEKGTAPLSAHAVEQLLADLRLDRLRVRHTTLDTAITAQEVDKGVGLSGLLALSGLPPDAETLAVGDSDPDLPMFRAATRSFAPSHIGCARLARLIGCRIAKEPYQRGLLSIVRSLVHP
ncbi:MAG TPA: HAD hydrolase family protein, partial [Gemmataceae bacterium]|nr:HAD hydrolase family protein [Gemmataceae bacterium]